MRVCWGRGGWGYRLGYIANAAAVAAACLIVGGCHRGAKAADAAIGGGY